MIMRVSSVLVALALFGFAAGCSEAPGDMPRADALTPAAPSVPAAYATTSDCIPNVSTVTVDRKGGGFAVSK